MSWHHESARLGSARVVPFFVRRFFRIAPAYYAAAALYYWLNPPIHGFNLVQLLASMLFVNGWTPALMPTAHDAWSVVPGGWSVSVEYTFYLLFPIFATFVTSLGRSIIVLSGCVVIGCLANRIADPMLLQSYGSDEIDNFLYFWFPNQMAVFAAGGVLFFAMQKLARPRVRCVETSSRTPWHDILPAVSIAVFLSGAFLPMAQWLGQPSAWFPGFLFASIPLASPSPSASALAISSSSIGAPSKSSSPCSPRTTRPSPWRTSTLKCSPAIATTKCYRRLAHGGERRRASKARSSRKLPSARSSATCSMRSSRASSPSEGAWAHSSISPSSPSCSCERPASGTPSV